MIQAIENMYNVKKEELELLFNTLDRATGKTIMMYPSTEATLNGQGFVILDISDNQSRVFSIRHDLNNMTVICTAHENGIAVGDVTFKVNKKNDFFTVTYKKFDDRDFKKIATEWFDTLEEFITYDSILPVKEETPTPTTDVEVVEGSEDGIKEENN